MLEMSVVLLTPDNYATVRRTMDHLRAQTARDRLEILVVTPSAARLGLDDAVRGDFGAVRVIEVGPFDSPAAPRATGIRAASAPIVALTEDHSFPEPTWAQALIQAHRQAWAAVGPVAVNANPGSVLSWANFVIEYGAWIDPTPGGVMPLLPGHNSSYKREVLLRYGDDLGPWLEAETLLHWDLRAKGHQLYLEPCARTAHCNFSRLLPAFSLRFHCARLFAALRAKKWSLAHRLIYIAGSPLIPLVCLYRILRGLQRPGRHIDRVLQLLPTVLLLLVFAAAGEVAGYAVGVGDAARRMGDLDFHRERFLNKTDQARLGF